MNQKLLLAASLIASLFAFPPLPAAAQLLTRSSYSTLSFPYNVVVADFDHDGAMDFAVSSDYSYGGGPGVEVYLGNGDGTFKSPAKYVVINGAEALAVGDLNHDGVADIVASSSDSDAVVVLLGNGDGTFRAPISYAASVAPGPVVLGDFNNDGKLDIAVSGSPNSMVVSVLLGNGDGTFQEPAIITYPPNGAPEAMVTGHFTASGNLDLALATNRGLSGDFVQILLGNGDGTFSTGTDYSIDPTAGSIVAADLRNNGITDLAVAPLESPGPAVLLGNGDGTFQQPVYYGLGLASSTTVAIGDMNGDGIPDLVSAPTLIANNTNYSAVYIFAGKGDGTFVAPEISFPVASNSFPEGLALADFNGDHKLDVAIADGLGNQGEHTLLNTGAIKFSPLTPLSFKNQRHGTTSPPQTVTLTNQGKATLFITSIKATGEFGATSTCGKSVAVKASCTISVTFSPKSAGAFSGAVQITDSASSKPQVIALSGKGN
jgi:hypothetical protein